MTEGSPVRVGIDARILSNPRYTGIERPLLGLLEGLREIADPPEVLLYARGEPSGLLDLPSCARWRILKARFGWLTIALPLAARRDRCDVVYFPYPVLPPYCRLPTVAMIHDLGFVRFPKHYPAEMLRNLVEPMRRSARRATHLAAVSESTKRDLVELFGIGASKISVVYHGVGAEFAPVPNAQEKVRARLGLERPYVLFVGTVQPRKNLPRLIEAFARVVGEQGIEHELVIAGQKGWLAEESLRAPQKFRVEQRVRFVDYVPEDMLPSLYSAADALAYPSLYEGFGLPALEAMACGVPVLASKTSSLPEVAGDAAILVDPASVEAIAEGLAGILLDERLRADLREKGIARARSFTWANSARGLISVFHRCADHFTALR
jgi:glycosyltransferase involved in cell wall biosynthesis